VSKPRDLMGYERSQAHREAIRQVMLEHMHHHPLRKPISGKAVLARLPHLGLALSTILWHMAAIREEAEAEAARDLVLESF
jgi:hypothetical protein